MSNTIFGLNYTYGSKMLHAEIIQTAKSKYYLHALRGLERFATHEMDSAEFKVFWSDLHNRYNHPSDDFNSVFALHNYAKCGTFDTDAEPIAKNVEVLMKTTKKIMRRTKKAAKALVKELRSLSGEEIEDLDDYQQSKGLPIHVALTLFEGKIDDLEMGAGHQDGTFWFDIDTSKSDAEMVTEIVSLIDIAHELSVEAKNDQHRWSSY